MNTKDEIQTAINLLPDEKACQLKISEVVSNFSVSVLYNELNNRTVSDIFSKTMDFVGIRDYQFKLSVIDKETHIERESVFCESAFCILILDANILLRECEQKVIRYISRHVAKKNQLIVLLLNTNMQPSKTAVMDIVENSLRTNKLDSPIIIVDDYDQEKLYEVISLYLDRNKPDLQAINAEILEDVRTDVICCLNNFLRDKNAELNSFREKLNIFKKNKETFLTFFDQLFVDLWLELKRCYEERLKDDVSVFAEKVRSYVSVELETIDVKMIMPYFGLYINYLWGQFINNEMSDTAATITKTMNEKLNELSKQYVVFFNENIQPLVFDISGVTQSGSIPFSMDAPDEYNRVLKEIVKRILNAFKWSNLCQPNALGILLSLLSSKLFKKYGDMLLIRKSDEQLKRIYSDALYIQFHDKEGLEEIKNQIQNVFIPVIQSKFDTEIESNKKMFSNDMEKIENGYNTKISDLEERIKCIKGLLN